MILAIAFYFTLFWGFDALRMLTSPTYGLEEVWRSQFVFEIGRLFGLAPLGIADRLGQREDLLGLWAGEEEHAIIVAENQILAADGPISDDRGLQRVMRAGVEPEGASGDRSQAEDRQPDRPYVSCVAMKPPDNHSLQPRGLNL